MSTKKLKMRKRFQFKLHSLQSYESNFINYCKFYHLFRLILEFHCYTGPIFQVHDNRRNKYFYCSYSTFVQAQYKVCYNEVCKLIK